MVGKITNGEFIDVTNLELTKVAPPVNLQPNHLVAKYTNNAYGTTYLPNL